MIVIILNLSVRLHGFVLLQYKKQIKQKNFLCITPQLCH